MFFERPEAGHRALLLQVQFPGSEPKTGSPAVAGPHAVAGAAAEAAELARSAELDVVHIVTASRPAPHPRWFVGTGKLEQIAQAMAAHDCSLLLVNHELSAGQQRDLEKHLGCRVITRTELILLIFASRARTYEGQLQVELAQLKHAQTRLVRGWTHLDRQKGGIGLRGAGETQIELDQRMLGERLKRVQARLANVRQRRDQSRRRRRRERTRTVALVGYTNAGKSTLFNALTSAAVLVEDKLFATLDPTHRRVTVPGAGEVVLSDTVGFINQLPHDLIEAFKATLEEVSSADLLLHVVDASCADVNTRVEEVNEVLREIGAHQIPTLTVFNKIDALPEHSPLVRPGIAHVSATQGVGLDELVAQIGQFLGVRAQPTKVLLSAGDGKTRAWLYRMGAVIDEQHTEDGQIALEVRADSDLLDRLARTPSVFLQVNEADPRISSLPN